MLAKNFQKILDDNMNIKVLVLVGYGINCDYETEFAFKLCGTETKRVHINDLINRNDNLENYHILVLPGGFSYADDIVAGKVLSNKMRTNLSEQVEDFVKEGKLVIGICNGFQAMVKYPLLPVFNTEQLVTLTFNDSGRFEDRWVYLKINPKSNCVFTKGIESMYLPVRHAEGKFITKDNFVLRNLQNNNQIVLWYTNPQEQIAGYPWNPNGSINNIAGICDKSGRIFGIMPHPEAYLQYTNHPQWTRKSLPEDGDGIQIFRNAIKFVRENF